MQENRSYIKAVVIGDLGIIVISWVLLYGISQVDQQHPRVTNPVISLPNAVVIAMSLTLISLLTFLGFYLGSDTSDSEHSPAMRNAITAGFVAFYLALLPYIFVTPWYLNALFTTAENWQSSEVAQIAADTVTFGREIFEGFTKFIALVLGFYFATQTIEHVVDTTQGKKDNNCNFETARFDTAEEDVVAPEMLKKGSA